MKVQQLAIEKLSKGRYQTRSQFNTEALQDLADSFRDHGIIQPLVVRPTGKGEYEIVAGERRWRAAQLAQMHEVPCIVRLYSDEDAAAVTTIENLQRKDLNPIEEAKAFQQMQEGFSYTHDELAAIVGKSRVYVTNSLRLLKLEPLVQTLLIEGQLLLGHGKTLAGVTGLLQIQLAQECAAKKWSVRQLEKALKASQSVCATRGLQHAQGPDVERLQRLASDRLGSEVRVDVNAGEQGGWFKVKFYDPETLAGVLDKLGVDYEVE